MAYIDPHNKGTPREPDHARRALHGLQRIASFTPSSTAPEGEFVDEISSTMHDCFLVFRNGFDYYPSVSTQNLTDICVIGSWMDTCLRSPWWVRGFPPVEPRFTLYTAGLRLYRGTVMYPRNWYEDRRNTEHLDYYTAAMMTILCKVLRITNVVLYVSDYQPPRYPPWRFDNFLRKRLTTKSLPSHSGDYYGHLNHNLRPENSEDFGRQLAVRDTCAKARATATNQEEPSESIQASGKQTPPWNTKTAQDPGQTGSDVLEIDWTDWDKLFPSTQDGQASPSSRPPIVEVTNSQYEMLQSRQPPVIHKLVPAEGIVAGGTEVTLLGSGFYQGLEISFGDSEATTTIFWGEKCLNCIVPPALQPGSVTVRFKHAHLQDFRTQQELQSRACTYKYIGDHKVEMQSSGVGQKATSQQQLPAEVGGTILASSVSKMSPVLLTNLAILKYMAECQAAPDVLSTRNDDIQEQVGRALISLRHVLERGPLDEDTILSAILLWSIEKIRNDQNTAERHWEGIRELIKLCPGFDIGAPLTRVCFLASLTLTTKARNSMTKISEVIAAAFRSVMESTIETDHDDQTVAIPSAPTPAATVYSPWSETDAEPPPYMLSPTPLKQACLIYAAVNARSNGQAYQDSGPAF